MNEDENMPPYSEFGGFDLLKELMGLINELDAAKDPTYEAVLRRALPSSQRAHATRMPEIRKIVSAWLKANRQLLPDALLALCGALWSTGWREERLVAIMLIARNEQAMDEVQWEMLRDWSGDLDNAELVDQLAEVTGRLLLMQPRLIGRIEQMASAYNPWQRRLALATMIVAGRDFAWEIGLQRMVERLKNDDDPAVKKAITWARREIKQREAGGG